MAIPPKSLRWESVKQYYVTWEKAQAQSTVYGPLLLTGDLAPSTGLRVRGPITDFLADRDCEPEITGLGFQGSLSLMPKELTASAL